MTSFNPIQLKTIDEYRVSHNLGYVISDEEVARKIIEEMKERFGTDKFVLSLMSQYTPYENIEKFPELDRKITSFEYNSVVDAAVLAGFKYGYMQDRCSAEKDYTPSFNLEGVKRKEECKNE